MTEIVVIDDVSLRFPEATRPALQKISAAFKSGEITGLVGPDGAGKTTLLRLIAGLLAPDSGSITVGGYDTLKDARAIHGIAGYMPQRFGLYEELSVLENLRLYADLRGVPASERGDVFERLLRFTDLSAFTGRFAGRLSGGMKQKLGLACALLRRPALLLLDEPTVGVDPVSRRELWRMIEELAGGREETAVVWSTAYLDEAEMCDSVLLLNEGAVLHAGPPAELIRPLEGRTYRLTGIEDRRREVLERVLESESTVDGIIQGSTVRLVMRDGERRPEPADFEAGDGASLEPVAPRFEDAFVDRLGGAAKGRSRLAERMERAGAPSKNVVEAKGLTKRFGDFTAVEDVAFSVPSGEIFGLLGPNGAGKSTTFKMMCGLLQPSAGESSVAGRDLKRAGSAARARIGYMAQKFSLYGPLSVGQNLEFFSGVYGLSGAERRNAVEEMVEIFGLGPFLDRVTDQLPLGYKQRLSLACATMHRPEVLFLDEPTSGVDPLTRREFWTHINGVVQRGVTVMVTTHFMDEAEYCDRIALLYRGRIVAIDPPDGLKKAVRSDANPDPTLEDAFIAMIEEVDRQAREAA